MVSLLLYEQAVRSCLLVAFIKLEEKNNCRGKAFSYPRLRYICFCEVPNQRGEPVSPF
jgi:hypothetical protein